MGPERDDFYETKSETEELDNGPDVYERPAKRLARKLMIRDRKRMLIEEEVRHSQDLHKRRMNRKMRDKRRRDRDDDSTDEREPKKRSRLHASG